MFTPFFTTTIPLSLDYQPATHRHPRPLQAIELVALSVLLLGIKVISNHFANLLLTQFTSG